MISTTSLKQSIQVIRVPNATHTQTKLNKSVNQQQ